MTLADATRAGLGIDNEADGQARRQRVARLLLAPLLFYMGAKNGGRARLEGRNDTRMWDMYYMQVQIKVRRSDSPMLSTKDRDIEIIPEFALCAFEDGGVGRKLSPLEALDHIDPQALRDRIAAAFARMGDADRIKV
ncbi:MAG: hypothetical protein ACOY4Y_09915 [Pseudomonadota bacterium]